MNTELSSSPAPSPARRIWNSGIAAGAIAFLLALVLTHGAWLIAGADAGFYIDMADGHIERVLSPFSNRYLIPAVVRVIHHGLGATRDHAFLAVNLASLFTFLVACAIMMARSGVGPAVAIPLLLLPIVLAVFESGFLPDLPHSALLALLFAMLAMGRRGWPCIILPVILLQLTRESTVLIAAVMAIVLWRRSQRGPAVGIAIACLTAMAAVAALVRHGAPNIHSMNAAVYMMGKAPFNFAKNILGVHVWTNTFDMRGLEPAWSMAVPRWMHLGAIRRVGFVEMNAAGPLATIQAWLTEFGIAPAVLLALLRSRHVKLRLVPIWIEIAVVYGIIAFLIGPSLGASVDRLVFYGWPAFIIATPYLLIRGSKLTPALVAGLLTLHLACCWLPSVLQVYASNAEKLQIVFLVIYLAIDLVAYRLVRVMAPPATKTDIEATPISVLRESV